MDKDYRCTRDGITFCAKDQLVRNMLPADILMHVNAHYEIFFSHTPIPIHYQLRDTRFDLTAGDVIVVPPGIPHCSYMKDGDVCIRHKIGIDKPVLDRFRDYSDILLPQTEKVLHLSPETYRACLAILDDMERNTHTETRAAACQLQLEALSLLLTIQSVKETGASVARQNVPRLFLEILAWVQEDNRFLSLSGNREIAEHFHISENYIPKLFHRYYPIPLKSLILKMRIRYASEHLKNGATVTEACFASGFSDCSHFISTFRRITGTTPGQYRKSRK